MTQISFPSLATLTAALDPIQASPKTQGALKLIVIRPSHEQRHCPQSVRLSPEQGLEGDRWGHSRSKDPEMQVSLMNSRVLEQVAATPERMSWAGDNLIVDFDLGEENLQVGDRLGIGEALLEITAAPHLGCHKFKRRFGKDALTFVNDRQHQPLYLRGRFARVIQAGTVRVGDPIAKRS